MFDTGVVSRWFRADDGREPYAPVAPRIRHVWVEAPGGHGAPAPGLVIAWRLERQPSSLATGWSAQVAVVHALDRLSIEWVSAEKLRPVEDPTSGAATVRPVNSNAPASGRGGTGARPG